MLNAEAVGRTLCNPFFNSLTVRLMMNLFPLLDGVDSKVSNLTIGNHSFVSSTPIKDWRRKKDYTLEKWRQAVSVQPTVGRKSSWNRRLVDWWPKNSSSWLRHNTNARETEDQPKVDQPWRTHTNNQLKEFLFPRLVVFCLLLFSHSFHSWRSWVWTSSNTRKYWLISVWPKT